MLLWNPCRSEPCKYLGALLYIYLFIFFYSALQLNDDIHLSLSPEPEDDQVFDDIDLSTGSKNNNMVCNSESNIPEGLKLAYRDAKSAPMQRSSSWYDGFLHCLKPVMTSFITLVIR